MADQNGRLPEPITEDEALIQRVEPVNGAIPSTPGEDVTTLIPSVTQRGEVVSDLGISYIAGTTQYPWLTADIALPQTIDDAELLYGPDIYDRMKREPILGGIERVLKILTLSDGLTVTPSHQQPPITSTDPDAQADFEKADLMAQYVRSVLARLADIDRPIMRTLWNLMDATRLGHKIAEVTYDTIPDGDFKGRLGIKELRPKPRENYAFVVDEKNRFRGIIAKIPGGSIALRTGVVFDVSQIPNTISPDKLLVLSFDDQDADPRGRSWWRELYDPWYRKQILKPEHLKTGVQFGGGMISVVMPDGKRAELVDDPSGGQIRNAKGGKVTLLDATLWAAAQLKNGGVGVFEFGTVIDVHTPKANSQFFDQSFAMFDREMVTAFLQTARSILEARHGSKADSESAQDLLDELKMYIRTCICELLTSKLFRTLVINGYGPEWAKYCPKATMQRTSRPDFAVNATAVAQLAAVFDQLAVTPNQKEYLKTEVAGMPPSESVVDPNATGDEDGDVDDTASDFKSRVEFVDRFAALHRISFTEALEVISKAVEGVAGDKLANFRDGQRRGIPDSDAGRSAKAEQRKRQIHQRKSRP